MERAERWQRVDRGIPSWTGGIWLDGGFFALLFLYLIVLTKTDLLMRLLGSSRQPSFITTGEVSQEFLLYERLPYKAKRLMMKYPIASTFADDRHCIHSIASIFSA